MQSTCSVFCFLIFPLSSIHFFAFFLFLLSLLLMASDSVTEQSLITSKCTWREQAPQGAVLFCSVLFSSFCSKKNKQTVSLNTIREQRCRKQSTGASAHATNTTRSTETHTSPLKCCCCITFTKTLLPGNRYNELITLTNEFFNNKKRMSNSLCCHIS